MIFLLMKILKINQKNLFKKYVLLCIYGEKKNNKLIVLIVYIYQKKFVLYILKYIVLYIYIFFNF